MAEATIVETAAQLPAAKPSAWARRGFLRAVAGSIGWYAVLIGISVHGGSGSDKAGLWSQNLLRAMRVAKDEFQATVVGFSGFDGGAFREVADVCLTVPFPSTPQVESFHLTLEHLITFCLKEKIANCSTP